MLLQSLVAVVVADNTVGAARLLGSAAVCWSWVSAFRLIREPEHKTSMNEGMWISGFGRF